jgi:hypothetical protein
MGSTLSTSRFKTSFKILVNGVRKGAKKCKIVIKITPTGPRAVKVNSRNGISTGADKPIKTFFGVSATA